MLPAQPTKYALVTLPSSYGKMITRCHTPEPQVNVVRGIKDTNDMFWRYEQHDMSALLPLPYPTPSQPPPPQPYPPPSDPPPSTLHPA